MPNMTVVGGGLAGLTAAVAGAERGMDVRLIEAKTSLGGRASTADAPFRANWGPHVVYRDGPMWRWLDERGLARPAGRAPITAKLLFRVDGRARRTPSPSLVRALLALRRRPAPVEERFTDWATEIVGERQAHRLAMFAGVTTFDHDPGRLSAAFVNERLLRATVLPPTVRYFPGGWATLVQRLATRARDLGVRIETGSRVDDLPHRPVILAAPIDVARSLTGDATLVATGTRTALLDVGVEATGPMPFVVSDLDASGWAETFSIPDPSVAPAGHHLIQAQAGLRPHESLDQGVARLEELLDAGYPGWRPREVWRRRARVEDQSGALDAPGQTWRDRPAIDRGDGVYVVGDMVAAPGLLSEVSHVSALRAVDAIAASAPVPRARRPAERVTDPAGPPAGGAGHRSRWPRPPIAGRLWTAVTSSSWDRGVTCTSYGATGRSPVTVHGGRASVTGPTTL